MLLSVNDRPIALRNVSAFVFDLDGTLVETEHVWAEAKSRVAMRHGRRPTEAELDAFVGRSLADFVAEFIGLAEGEGRDGALRGIREIAQARLPESVRPIPGAADLVNRAHACGLRLAICSSAPAWAIRVGLEALGVADLIEASVSAAEMKAGKPDKQPYLEALSALRLAADQAVAFEDSQAGIASASAAGIATVAIGNHSPANMPPQVFAICGSVADVGLRISGAP